METICCLQPPKPITVLGPEQSTEGHNPPLLPTHKVPGCLAHPPMDWKPPDFFFFLFWARTISRVSGSTSEVHSEVGKVGRGLPGPSWEGATERQHHSRSSESTRGREGGCPVASARPSPCPMQGDDTPARSHDFSAKGLSFDRTRTGHKVRELALQTDGLRFNPNSVTSSCETSDQGLRLPEPAFPHWENGDDESVCLIACCED